MEQNNFEQQVSTPMPPKPDNNLVLAIICTICCCLPLGIVGIVKANKVNGLYYAKQYEAANLAAQEAKKWSLIGMGVGLFINHNLLVSLWCNPHRYAWYVNGSSKLQKTSTHIY